MVGGAGAAHPPGVAVAAPPRHPREGGPAGRGGRGGAPPRREPRLWGGGDLQDRSAGGPLRPRPRPPALPLPAAGLRRRAAAPARRPEAALADQGRRRLRAAAPALGLRHGHLLAALRGVLRLGALAGGGGRQDLGRPGRGLAAGALRARAFGGPHGLLAGARRRPQRRLALGLREGQGLCLRGARGPRAAPRRHRRSAALLALPAAGRRAAGHRGLQEDAVADVAHQLRRHGPHACARE
mmetsp:Transcript_50561/g.156467  ORF Transcript_50561/g.156467 Transcript_50561/m.156467 type:complete len:240 (-) Transcript_50561:135-854(-)